MCHRSYDYAPEWGYESSLVRRLCDCLSDVAGFHGLLLRSLIESENWAGVLNFRVDASQFEDPQHFAAAYLLASLLKKSPWNPVTSREDRQIAALASFRAGEDQCRLTNDRLLANHPVGQDGLNTPSWLPRARDYIHGIMGDLLASRTVKNPVRPLERITQLMRHGPGSTTDLPYSRAYRASKFGGLASCTSRLQSFSAAIMGPRWASLTSEPAIPQEAGKWTCVPKDAKTDRGIEVPPTLNVFAQLGVGAYLKERLAYFGIDLRNGWVTNRDFARRAYEDRLATLDLKSASDTLSWSVVLLLFPAAWVELLSLLRTDQTELPSGEVVNLEKFSAMGCGFTFELETIVFLACARAIVPRAQWGDVVVFGDDIIVPAEFSGEVVEALNYLGFSVNTEKSFWQGDFFESCGGHFFKGVDVTPFRLRGPTPGTPYNLTVANALRAWMDRTGIVNPELEKLWRELIRDLSSPWRKTFGPPELGDTCVHRGLDEISGLRRAFSDPGSRGWEGVFARTITFKPKLCELGGEGVILRDLYDRERGDEPLYQALVSWGVHPRRPCLEFSFRELGTFRDLGPAFPRAMRGKEPLRGFRGLPTRAQVIVSSENWPAYYGCFTHRGRM